MYGAGAIHTTQTLEVSCSTGFINNKEGITGLLQNKRNETGKTERAVKTRWVGKQKYAD